jgi:putative phosphoesterase
MPCVGLISDTHGYLDPQVPGLLAGVDHIIHAGDIGWPKIVLELEAIAPVTAVLGNTDVGLHFRETELVEIAGLKFLVHHIVEPHRPAESLRRRLDHAQPDVVVFGHTHATFCEVVNGALFVNPGAAGKPRFGKPRTLGILRWTTGREDLAVDFSELH